MQKRLRINNFIRVPEVALIDENGNSLGVTPTGKAMQLAFERDLDLVEVGPDAQPPIAKIMDFGRYMYQKERQEKNSAGKHKAHETKTVRVGYKTGDHDLAFKAKKADEFLEEGHNLKVELTLRGREKALAHLGKDKLIKFLGRLTQPHTLQGTPTRSPYGWVIMVQKDKHGKNQQSAPKAHQDNKSREDSKAPKPPESL